MITVGPMGSHRHDINVTKFTDHMFFVMVMFGFDILLGFL